MCNNCWHRILTVFCLIGVVMAADSALAFDPGFKARLDYGVGYWPYFLVSSDLDRDGDIDLAVPNNGSNNVSVLLNNGDGTFQTAVNYGVAAETYSLVSSDLDGDGDIDLTVKNYHSENVSVLENSTYTVIKEGEVIFSSTPASPALYQNYPNPFNPITQIKYALPRDCPVNLEVYNILGQKVASLVDGKQKAGYKTARWDASSFSSGIYFYKLQAGDFVQTRKMAVLK